MLFNIEISVYTSKVKDKMIIRDFFLMRIYSRNEKQSNC